MTLILPTASFVAVPKTGTISVEEAYGFLADGFRPHLHEPVDVVRKRKKQVCFGVIREPVGWITSYYKYLKYSPYFNNTSTFGLRTKTFDQFVEKYVEGKHQWPEPLFHQASYLDRHGERVDFIYRFEELNRLVSDLSSITGVSVEVAHRNKSPDCDLKLDPALKKMFEDHTKRDYDIYESVK
mgnify:CR=1 FL=1